MPLATSYTEDTFATYLHTTVGGVAALLQWSVAGDSYARIVYRVMRALSLTDIADGDAAELEVVGDVYVWKAALEAAAILYDFKANEAEFRRNQVVKTIQANIREAEQNPLYLALPIAQTRYGITQGTVTFSNDPYANDRSNTYHRRGGDVDE